MHRLAAVLALGCALVFGSGSSRAEDWPSRPIHVLTTSSAGGLSDLFMRVLNEELRAKLGQPLIIENRPGGTGNIAARACSESAPDGYTICIIQTDPIAFNQFLYKKLPFDPEKGLVPIVNLFHIIQVMVVNAELKVKNVDELVAASKAKAGTMSYLTASLPLVVFMDSLKKNKGADWVRVPFKGGGEATNAILSGSTPIGLLGLGNVLTQIKGGKMTPLVLASNIRSPNLPNVPTLEDIGYKGAPSRTWYGLFAPAGTPKPIIDRINKEVRAIVAQPEFTKKYLTDRSLLPAVNSPEEFAAEIKADRLAAEQVVKASGLQPQ